MVSVDELVAEVAAKFGLRNAGQTQTLLAFLGHGLLHGSDAIEDILEDGDLVAVGAEPPAEAELLAVTPAPKALQAPSSSGKRGREAAGSPAAAAVGPGTATRDSGVKQRQEQQQKKNKRSKTAAAAEVEEGAAAGRVLRPPQKPQQPDGAGLKTPSAAAAAAASKDAGLRAAWLEWRQRRGLDAADVAAEGSASRNARRKSFKHFLMRKGLMPRPPRQAKTVSPGDKKARLAVAQKALSKVKQAAAGGSASSSSSSDGDEEDTSDASVSSSSSSEEQLSSSSSDDTSSNTSTSTSSGAASSGSSSEISSTSSEYGAAAAAAVPGRAAAAPAPRDSLRLREGYQQQSVGRVGRAMTQSAATRQEQAAAAARRGAAAAPKPAATGGARRTGAAAAAVDVSKYPLLQGVPSVGNVVAYKLLEITLSMCPEVSEARFGRVTAVDAAAQRVTLAPWPEASGHPLQHVIDAWRREREERAALEAAAEGDGGYEEDEEGVDGERRSEEGEDEEEEELPFQTSYGTDGTLTEYLSAFVELRLVQAAAVAAGAPPASPAAAGAPGHSNGFHVQQAAAPHVLPIEHAGAQVSTVPTVPTAGAQRLVLGISEQSPLGRRGDQESEEGDGAPKWAGPALGPPPVSARAAGVRVIPAVGGWADVAEQMRRIRRQAAEQSSSAQRRQEQGAAPAAALPPPSLGAHGEPRGQAAAQPQHAAAALVLQQPRASPLPPSLALASQQQRASRGKVAVQAALAAETAAGAATAAAAAGGASSPGAAAGAAATLTLDAAAAADSGTGVALASVAAAAAAVAPAVTTGMTPGAIRPRGGTRRSALGPLLNLLRQSGDV